MGTHSSATLTTGVIGGGRFSASEDWGDREGVSGLGAETRIGACFLGEGVCFFGDGVGGSARFLGDGIGMSVGVASLGGGVGVGVRAFGVGVGVGVRSLGGGVGVAIRSLGGGMGLRRTGVGAREKLALSSMSHWPRYINTYFL